MLLDAVHFRHKIWHASFPRFSGNFVKDTSLLYCGSFLIYLLRILRGFRASNTSVQAPENELYDPIFLRFMDGKNL